MDSTSSPQVIVNGKKLADEILAELKKEFKKLPRRLSVGAVLVGENPASESFLKQKAKVAEFLGVDFEIFRYDAKIKTEKLKKEILKISENSLKNNGTTSRRSSVNGIIVQLPLPKHIKTDLILNAINPKKDIDALSKNPKVLAPTVEAVKFILEKYGINYKTKNILIVGRGRLVGQPIFNWLVSQESYNWQRGKVKIHFYFDRVNQLYRAKRRYREVMMLKKIQIIDVRQKNQLPKLAREADIIISGVGKAGLTKGDMIKKGAILIDFGFNKKDEKISPFDKLRTDGKRNRTISGDFDFESCVKKARLITPVPGGMGPIMVAMLFSNLIKLNKKSPV